MARKLIDDANGKDEEGSVEPSEENDDDDESLRSSPDVGDKLLEGKSEVDLEEMVALFRKLTKPGRSSSPRHSRHRKRGSRHRRRHSHSDSSSSESDYRPPRRRRREPRQGKIIYENCTRSYNSCLMWVRMMDFKVGRNRKECERLAHAIDGFIRMGVSCTDPMESLLLSLAGVFQADQTGDWAICDVTSLASDAHGPAVLEELLGQVHAPRIPHSW